MRFLLPLLLVACGPDVSTPEAFVGPYLEAYCAQVVECSNDYTIEDCMTDYEPGERAAYTGEACTGWDVSGAATCLRDFDAVSCGDASLTPSSCSGLCGE